jgi:hypothetical protein
MAINTHSAKPTAVIVLRLTPKLSVVTRLGRADADDINHLAPTRRLAIVS